MEYNKTPTKEQLKRFVDDGGTFCPHCGGMNIINRGDPGGDPYCHEHECSDCLGRWLELATVSGLILREEKPIALAERALREVNDFFGQCDFSIDFKNGVVSPDGMDEGEILGIQAMARMMKQIEIALKAIEARGI
jgi:hypothetical protein